MLLSLLTGSHFAPPPQYIICTKSIVWCDFVISWAQSPRCALTTKPFRLQCFRDGPAAELAGSLRLQCSREGPITELAGSGCSGPERGLLPSWLSMAEVFQRETCCRIAMSAFFLGLHYTPLLPSSASSHKKVLLLPPFYEQDN